MPKTLSFEKAAHKMLVKLAPCNSVGVGEESVCRWLIDELGDEDNGREDAGDEAHGTDDNVQVG